MQLLRFPLPSSTVTLRADRSATHAARLAAALVTLLAAGPLAAQSAERFTLDGRDVTVYDPAGRVRLVAGSGPDVAVEVTRGGRDAGRLRVQTADGGRALVVIPPEGDLVYPALGRHSRATFRLKRDGTFDGNSGGMFDRGRLTVRGDGDGTEAWADMVVRVPRGARVTVHVGAGVAEASNVAADLTLRLQAAEARTEGTRGRLLVDAGSGAVRVRDAEGDDINLDTGSGSVEVHGVRARRLRIDTGSGSARGGDLSADRPGVRRRLGLGAAGPRARAQREPRHGQRQRRRRAHRRRGRPAGRHGLGQRHAPAAVFVRRLARRRHGQRRHRGGGARLGGHPPRARPPHRPPRRRPRADGDRHRLGERAAASRALAPGLAEEREPPPARLSRRGRCRGPGALSARTAS
jgi:hypothetical protein